MLRPITKVAPISKSSAAFATALVIIFIGEKSTWPVASEDPLVVTGSIVIIAFKRIASTCHFSCDAL